MRRNNRTQLRRKEVLTCCLYLKLFEASQVEFHRKFDSDQVVHVTQTLNRTGKAEIHRLVLS